MEIMNLKNYFSEEQIRIPGRRRLSLVLASSAVVPVEELEILESFFSA